MRVIKSKDRVLLIDKRQQCSRCGRKGVQWHHVFMYSGRQIEDWFNIAFACEECHHKATPHNNKYIHEVREFFEHEVLSQNLLQFVAKYPKGDWVQKLKYLNKKYGVWMPYKRII